MNTTPETQELQVPVTEVRAGDVLRIGRTGYYNITASAPAPWFSTAERAMVVRLHVESPNFDGVMDAMTPMFRADTIVTVSRKVA